MWGWGKGGTMVWGGAGPSRGLGLHYGLGAVEPRTPRGMGVLQSPRDLMLLHAGFLGWVLQGGRCSAPPVPSTDQSPQFPQEPQSHILPPAPRVTPGWDISHPHPLFHHLQSPPALGSPLSRGSSPLHHPFPGA